MMRRRSRSPLRFESAHRRERSLSMSSLSSCSLGDERKAYARKDTNASNDKRHARYEDKNHERIPKRHEKSSGSKERQRYKEHVESNKSYSTSSSRKLNDIMEESVDPSICHFRGSASGTHDETEENDLNISRDRLERLEKMMEVIVQNKTQVSNVKTALEQSDLTFPGELIPRNTNFTISMWLNRISEECLERNFDENTCMKFVESKMTGIIKAWYKSLESNDYTWPELKMLITKSFPDNVEFASTLRLLVDRVKKPEETVTQYYFSKMYLIEACKISGVNAVSCLIDGLMDPYLQQEAKACNFLTPESLYSQYLSKLQNYEMMQQNNIQEQREMLSRPMLREIHLVEDYPVMDQFQPKPTNRRPPNEPYASKQCYTCGKFGHIAEMCRHAPVCYNCGQKGHIAAKCKNKSDC